MDSWIVINTHIYKEEIALENLRRQNFRVYYPVIRKSIRHARQVREALRPLFPSYLFVHFSSDISQSWRPMTSTYGVRSVVQCGDRPSLLDNAFVESLKAREVNGVIAQPSPSYKAGQQVRIDGGPFAGVVATIIEVNEKDRLTLLMHILKSEVHMRINSQSVTAL